MSELLKRLEHLSPKKRELVLQKLLAQQSTTNNKQLVAPIESISRNQLIPLSFAQQRLWFLDQMESNSSAYNMAAAVEITGAIEISVLERTIAEIVRRHEILRTNFRTVNENAIQVISPNVAATLPVVDLHTLTPEEQYAAVQRLAKDEQIQPFDLTKDCLLRASLLHLAAESHVLLVTMHHIVSDGWSMGIFVQEFCSLYEAFSQGKESPLDELTIQYADFAHWQRHYLQGEVLENQLDYWKKQLASSPPILELPTDRPRPPVQAFKGQTLHFELNQHLARQLNTISQKSGTTLFMTLMAAFVTLLYRYSNQSDIAIGSPIANRDRRETHSLIGLFVNTLVLRTNLEGNPSFTELLERVREVAMSAYAHQDMPLEQLVEALQPERSLSYMPLFQVAFVMQNAPMGKLELPNLSLNLLKIENNTAKFDLALSVQETESGLLGEWEFNTDLFDATTITRMAGCFQTLLENIVANPQQPIAEISLLKNSDSHQLLVEWNDTQTDYPRDKSIHQLFEKQVEETPNAVAVVFENQQLTYQELNCRANQVAHYLRSLGVGSDTLVGICVERSLDMVVGLLGIIKAGGAYVPLDPTYPAERLSLMLSDARVLVLLTQQHLAHRFWELEVKQVCLDADWETVNQNSQENPVNNTTPENLAYVIYTSGSTGKPKGAMIPHRGVNRLVLNTNYVQIRTTDVIGQVSNCSFDAATFEIWGALLNGARLVIVSQDILLSPQEFATCIREHKLGIMFLTTALFNQIAKDVPTAFESMRYLLVGGEAIDPRWIKKVLQHGAPENLLNAYGPTENTTFSVSYQIEYLPEGTTNIPIGKAIANTTTYVLDSYLQPVPVGVKGELYLGGDGLAIGYLNRPELNAEKFIPNPFDNSQYLYKTGDLVKYLPDGNIEFISRIDNLVKIRGFRIELGEIEAVLQKHPDICDVVVLVREDEPGQKRLVAYIVLHQSAATINELRHYLKEKLPEYMVPSAFVMLESLPINLNGKVDRRALPAPDASRSSIDSNFVPPRTNTEKTLATIWAEVLRLEQVGVCDNFFELGGDSILTIQVVARANQAGLVLTPKQLFQHQTIAELSTAVGIAAPIQAEQGLVTGSLPLTPIQHWFFEQNLPEPAHFNQSVLLEVPSELNQKLLEQALQQLLLHHDALRLRFVKEGESWLQTGAGAEDVVPLSVVDLSTIAGREQQAALETAATCLQASLNLSAGPLMQAALFRLGGDKKARLLIIVHHLAVDGVSWRILIEDLFNTYQQISRGDSVQLPPKTSSFKDWASKLAEYGKEMHATELDFWLQLTGYNPLPVDYADTQDINTVASSALLSVSLSEEQTRALLQEVPFVYNTQINDVLLTALAQSFTQWTNKSSLLIDIEGHGREELFEDIDLSRTVGWFTTLFPIKLELAKVNHPGQALKSIKEQIRPNQKRGIIYGILRYLSQDPAIRQQLETLPQAEVSFNYLGQFDQSSSTSWQFAQSAGDEQSTLGNRSHLLEVNAFVESGKLQFNWTYSQNIHKQSTVEALTSSFIKALVDIIEHCQSPNAGGYTPSDFPLSDLTQQHLDNLMAEVAKNRLPNKKKQIESIYPLSPMQQGILFHTLYNPDSEVYCEQLSCTLHGHINTTAFERAWQKVVERHPALRSFFVWENLYKPHQVVCKSVNLPFTYYDWRPLDTVEQQNQLQAFQEADRDKGFALNQAPLLRCSLIQTADDTHEFVWSFHHLLIDGWSLPIIVQEAFAFYAAANKGEDLHLATPRAFQDYITWLQQQNLTEAKQFWKQTLKGFTAPTKLIADKSIVSNSDQKQTYHEQHIKLPQTLATELESLAKQHQLTLNTLMQGIWSLLLKHYSGQEDVVFGTTTSGRPPSIVGVESMVGMFINALPVRVQVSSDAQLLPWLKDLHVQQVEREQYSYTPLVEIQRVSEIPTGTPMFETNVAFYNYPIDPSLQNSNNGLKVDNISSFERSKYPLMLVIMPGADLSVGLSYEGNRFTHETIARILEDFANIACQITEQPHVQLKALEEKLVQTNKQKQLVKDQELAKTTIQKLKKFRRQSA